MVLQKGIFLSGRRMLAGDGEAAFPLLLPPGVGKELRAWEQTQCLLRGAVSKQLWNLLRNPHSDVSPRSSGSRGQCMKSSLKFS